MERINTGSTKFALERLKKSASHETPDNIAVLVLDEGGEVLNFNQVCADLLCLNAEQNNPLAISDFLPLCQPNGTRSWDEFVKYTKVAFSSKTTKFDWLFKRLDGIWFHSDVMVSLEAKGDSKTFVWNIKNKIPMQEAVFGTGGKNQGMSEEAAVVLEHAPTSIFFIDENLNILDCNKHMLETFAIKDTEEFTNKFFKNFSSRFQNSISSEDYMRLHIQKAMLEGDAKFNWTIRRDYEESPSSIKLIRTTYESQPCCIAFLSEFETDIDPYFDGPVENSLLGERMWSLLDAMPFVWDFLDLELNCIDCNIAAAQWFGFKDKQEYMARYHETFPPTQPCGTPSFEKAKQYVDEAMENGMVRFEWMHQKPNDKSLLPGEVTLIRVGIKNRFVLAVFVRDLSEQYAREEQQRREEGRFYAILDNMPLAVHLWDKDNNLIFCNNYMVDMLGFKDKEDYMKNFYSIYPETQPAYNNRLSTELSDELIQEVFMKGDYKADDWLLISFDGTPVYVDCSLTMVMWGDNYAVLEFCKNPRQEI